MDYNEFRDTVKKINLPRVHKITNSIGTYDIYKLIRKNGWKNIGHPISEKDFYTIIRETNKLLAEELLKGKEVTLPARMGTLELRKLTARIKIVDGQLVTNLPIDWDATIKLWYEDEEAFNSKYLVRAEPTEIFRVHYNKTKANYNNKSFYHFRPTRTIKKQLSILAKEGTIDAYLYTNYD